MNKGVVFDNIYSTLYLFCESTNCSCSKPIGGEGTVRVSNELNLFKDDIYCHTCAEFDCSCIEPVLRCSECSQINCNCECTICGKVDCICTCDDCRHVKCICDDLSKSGNYYCSSCKRSECNYSTSHLLCLAPNHLTHTLSVMLKLLLSHHRPFKLLVQLLKKKQTRCR